MKKTKNILKALDYTILGELPDKITSIHNNSKEVKPGSLFFAIKGTKVDGHKYIPEAIKNGAEAIILEDKQDQLEVPQIIVEDSRSALSKVAKSFYDDPSSQLKVVGITGTNGKTSVVYILHKIFISSGIKAGKIGTLGYTIGQNDFECSLTTPGIIELQKIFKKMVNNNVKVVAMEVSSHALALGRVNDITFSGACFTNLSQDHLDFHKTMQAYANAKAKLFSMLNKDGFAICNIDSDYSEMFIKNCSAQLLTYSLAGDADYTWSEGTTFHNSIEGIVTTPKSKIKIKAPLAGKFNLQNVLAAVAISDKLAITTNKISQALQNIDAIPGRIQEVSPENGPRIFIDYAHTPDAITNILEELKALVPKNGRLIVIYGCGGDRDKTKRPLMTKAVEEYASLSILTSDNPRFEKPEDIIHDAEKGFSENTKYKIIIDRKEAIHWALDTSNKQDVIAILGKGHETYQEIKGKRYPFSDFKIVQDWINAKQN